MKKQEIIEKAKSIEKTKSGLSQLRDLEMYASENECGCSTKQEWDELQNELTEIRREMKKEIKAKR